MGVGIGTTGDDGLDNSKPAGRGLFAAYGSLIMNRAPFADNSNDTNELSQQNDSIADIFSLLQADALLKPEFYTDDRNATQALADIKFLLGQATRDFATLRNVRTTDPSEIGELRAQLHEDIGRIAKLFETLANAAHFQGVEKQDISSLPTQALARNSIGNGVITAGMQRVNSRLEEVSKQVNKAATTKLGNIVRPKPSR